jgi:hypothetical protein
MDTNPSLMGFIRIISQLFNISEIEAAFCVGGIVIGGFLGVVGRIAFKLGVWNKARGAANIPMQAFTSKTPAQVVGESKSASMKITLTLVMIILACACAGLYIYLNRVGEWQAVRQTIENLLRPFITP